MLNFGIGATKRTKKNPCPPAKKTTARKKAAPKARATAAPKARKPKALMPSASSIYAQGTMLPAVIAKPKTVRKRKAAAPKAVTTTTAAPKTRRKSCKGLTPSQCYRLNAGVWKSYKTPLQEACSEAGYATKNAFFGYSRKRAAAKLAKCNWLKGGYINRQKGLVRTKKKYTSL